MSLKQPNSGQTYTEDASVAPTTALVYLISHTTYYAIELARVPDARLLNQAHGAYETLTGSAVSALPELGFLQYSGGAIVTFE